MSILIKGMEMPNSCVACRFGKETNYLGDFEEKCLVNGKCGYVSVKKPRLDTCPLTEIKEPHGRLIDADEMIRIWDGSTIEGSVKPLINARPTVIEAEGSET